MSRSPCLWIVDPSIHHAEIQGVAEIRHRWPGEVREFRPVLSPGDGPTPADGYAADGVVIMGSAASVHESLPWMERLGEWLEPIVAGRRVIPLLGICFGHQLIARLAGGRVGFLTADHGKRVGVENTRIEGSRLLGERREMLVVVSHREEVKGLPAGYRRVAYRDGVANDGMEHEERPVFSFQFHPEAREEFASRAGIDPGKLVPRVREDSQLLLGAFRATVLGIKASRRTIRRL
jgi:GMP synthase-like glutamine amidotransferase